MQYFFSSNILGNKIILSKEESAHCVVVLRHKVGSVLYVVDGQGGEYKAKIIEANKNVELEIISKTQKEKNKSYIHIVIAPTKSNQRLEWFIEKAIEIGIDEISFIRCSNSERKKINLDRINKIALMAMKQSLKAYYPKINNIDKFSNIIQRVNQKNKYIGHLSNESKVFLADLVPKEETYCLTIGPEGDFSKDELDYAVNNDFLPVLLSKSRLRTETAGIAGCVILNGANHE